MKRRSWVVAVLVLGVVGLLLGRRDGTRTDGARVERETYVMGTTLRAVVRVADAGREGAVAAGATIDDAFSEVARMESLLSSWDSTSGLSKLNRARPGRAVAVDPELLGLLSEAWAWSDSTGGAFEPAVGSLVDVRGLRTGGREPTAAEVEDALAAVRAGFRLDVAPGTATRLHEAAWIDAGGFGKGAGLRAAGERLRDLGVTDALLDFGGQGLVLGGADEGGGWRIAVAHPVRRSRPVATLLVSDRSVATSGASERPGHLLDPRTGASLAAWGSVTVVHPDPLAADALSTGLYVLGPEAAAEWARGRTDVGVLILESGPDGLRARWNREMERWLAQPPAVSEPARLSENSGEP